jgi:EAL and modified HD-GYP domain-containing signal transduction protein
MQGTGHGWLQNYYFAKPETLTAKVIHPTFSNALELLNLLRMDADLRKVEQILKRDVALSYKLLRYVNSAAAGLNTTISSFSHAVTVLGTKSCTAGSPCYWLPHPTTGTHRALQKTAVTRGRLMELLGTELGMNLDDCDNLFIVGMFSLLDVLFDMPMNAILEHLQLPVCIIEALAAQGLDGHAAATDPVLRGWPAQRCGSAVSAIGHQSEQLNQSHVAALACGGSGLIIASPSAGQHISMKLLAIDTSSSYLSLALSPG